MLYSLVFLTLWYSRLCLDFLSRMPAQGSQHLSLSHWSLLFFIPSFSTSLWQEHSPPCTYFFLANLHVLVPPMLNPVIYGAKTKQMRGSMTHMVSAVEVLREGTALNAFSVSLTNMKERELAGEIPHSGTVLSATERKWVWEKVYVGSNLGSIMNWLWSMGSSYF